MKLEELKPGQPVKVRMLGSTGEVRELRPNGSVAVLVKGVTMDVMPHDLDPVKGGVPA